MSELTVQHEDKGENGAFVISVEGKRVGEMTYKRKDAALVDINHTLVDESLRGQGAARKLLDAAVAWARESKTKVVATCTYTKAQFEKDESIRDVLQQS